MKPKWQKLASLAQEMCTLWFQFFGAVFASKGYPFKNIFYFSFRSIFEASSKLQGCLHAWIQGFCQGVRARRSENSLDYVFLFYFQSSTYFTGYRWGPMVLLQIKLYFFKDYIVLVWRFCQSQGSRKNTTKRTKNCKISHCS